MAASPNLKHNPELDQSNAEHSPKPDLKHISSPTHESVWFYLERK